MKLLCVCFPICMFSIKSGRTYILSGFGANTVFPVLVQQWLASLPSTGSAIKSISSSMLLGSICPVYHCRMPSQSFMALEDVHASTHDGSHVTSMPMLYA